MKYYLLALSLVVMAGCQNNKPEQQDKNQLSTDLVNNPRSADSVHKVDLDKMPTLDFKDTAFDFGTIHEGEVVKHEFSFTNNGKSPLIIGGATASCGCTAAGYPKDPIEPGKTATMTVTFNSTGKSGHQVKTVTVTDNTARGNHFLTINAEVAAKK